MTEAERTQRELRQGERIAVLESQVVELKAQMAEMQKTLAVLSEHCPDRNDLSRRFEAIGRSIQALAAGKSPSLIDRIFG